MKKLTYRIRSIDEVGKVRESHFRSTYIIMINGAESVAFTEVIKNFYETFPDERILKVELYEVEEL
jgi:hypothetical protein